MKKIIAPFLILIFFSTSKAVSQTSSKSKHSEKFYTSYKTNIVSEDEVFHARQIDKSINLTEDEIFNSNEDFAFNPSYNYQLGNEISSAAFSYIGTRYQHGGLTKAGLDCSGLMFKAFEKFDISLPRTATDQSKKGIKIDPQDAKKGDLIFFSTKGHRRINHVGMVTDVSQDEIKFIHASCSRGVIVSSTKESYYKKDFVQVNRILN